MDNITITATFKDSQESLYQHHAKILATRSTNVQISKEECERQQRERKLARKNKLRRENYKRKTEKLKLAKKTEKEKLKLVKKTKREQEHQHSKLQKSVNLKLQQQEQRELQRQRDLLQQEADNNLILWRKRQQEQQRQKELKLAKLKRKQVKQQEKFYDQFQKELHKIRERKSVESYTHKTTRKTTRVINNRNIVKARLRLEQEQQRQELLRQNIFQYLLDKYNDKYQNITRSPEEQVIWENYLYCGELNIMLYKEEFGVELELVRKLDGSLGIPV